NRRYKKALKTIQDLVKNPLDIHYILQMTRLDYFNIAIPDQTILYSDICVIGGRIAEAIGNKRKARSFYDQGVRALDAKAYALAVGWISSGGSTRWSEETTERIKEQVEMYSTRQESLKDYKQRI
ncbi:MAG: hypothetical protein AABX59_00840, partial [Nanoarchaeota archaeon]